MPFNEISISMIVYVGIIASVGGTTMWNEGTWRVGGAQAGYFGNLYPVFAGALAIFILGEKPEWYHGAGAILVIAGIWLAIFEREPK
jgi:drug/metabolite transporter (DMT)-like permease